MRKLSSLVLGSIKLSCDSLGLELFTPYFSFAIVLERIHPTFYQSTPCVPLVPILSFTAKKGGLDQSSKCGKV